MHFTFTNTEMLRFLVIDNVVLLILPGFGHFHVGIFNRMIIIYRKTKNKNLTKSALTKPLNRKPLTLMIPLPLILVVIVLV